MILDQYTHLGSNQVGVASDRLVVDGCLLCGGNAEPRDLSYTYVFFNTWEETKVVLPLCNHDWERFKTTRVLFTGSAVASAGLGILLLYLSSQQENQALVGVPAMALICASIFLFSFFRNRALPFRVRIKEDFGREALVFTFREAGPAMRLHRANAPPPVIGPESSPPQSQGRDASDRPARPSGRPTRPSGSGRQIKPSGRQIKPSGRQIKPSGRQIKPSGRQIKPREGPASDS